MLSEIRSQYPTKQRLFGLTEADIGKEPWIFRRLVANMVVGGSKDESAVSVATSIGALYSTPQSLESAPKDKLIRILQNNEVRFAERKVEYLQGMATRLIEKFDGKVPNNRQDLESIKGVGRHVASVVLSLAFNQNEMAVDLHVRRIARRLELVGPTDTDLKIEKTLVKLLKGKDLATTSRAFVDFGKTVCGFEPNCGSCTLSKSCPTGNGSNKIEVDVESGRYSVIAGSSKFPYIVTQSGKRTTCGCKGFRFRSTCNHVKAVQGLVEGKIEKVVL